MPEAQRLAEHVAAPNVLIRLRAALAAGHDDLQRAARALGASPRTLQHHLAAADTSSRAELGQVRLSRAMHLLARTDTPITAIAIEVGFSSSQQFSRWFRKHLGTTPSAWRRGA